MIKEDFGARTARTGIAHRPEVVGSVRRTLVVTDAHHALCRDADFLSPDVIGLIVGGVDGDPELFLGQIQPFVAGQELPGVSNGIALEIVAEAEVTQHLEKRVVTRGVADVLQIVVLAAGTHTLLAGGSAGIGALFQAEETVLELVHPRVGEQQGRIIRRNQRTGGHTGVPLLFEEAEEGFTDFCAFHSGLPGELRAKNADKTRIISGSAPGKSLFCERLRGKRLEPR